MFQNLQNRLKKQGQYNIFDISGFKYRRKISLQTNIRFKEAYCETRPAKLTNHNIGNNSIQDLIIYKKAEKIINSNIDLLQFFIINKVEFKIEFVEAKLREDEE